MNNFTPHYLRNYLIFQVNNNFRNRPPIKPMFARTKRYENSFFPYCINQWNSLDSRIRNLPSISRFKRALFDFFRPKPPLQLRINNTMGFTLLTRLRVGFSHLREHKFRHGFADTIDPFCSCRANSIENCEHYLILLIIGLSFSTIFNDLKFIEYP